MNFNSLTINELQKWLKEHGYYVHYKMNKHILVKKCEEHESWEKNPIKFDMLDKCILTHFGNVVDPRLAVKFGNLNKRLRNILSSNFIWLRLSKTLNRFDDIHPSDLRRMQPEGFWKNWYMSNCPTSIIASSSYYAKRQLRGGDIIETIYPSTGSILLREIIDLTGNKKHIRYVCVEVIKLTRGPNKGLPKEIKLAVIHKEGSILDPSLISYHKHDIITDKIGESGRISSDFMIKVPNAI